MYKLSIFLIIFSVQLVFSQVGIGTTSPDSSTKLDIVATDAGILIPRMSEVQRTAISSPATSLLVYQIDNTAGFYYYTGSTWTLLTNALSTVTKIDDLSDGKSDNDGTQDGSSIFLGVESGLNDNATDNRNIAIGYQTLRGNIFGNSNIAIGHATMLNNTNGYRNVAIGTSTLQANTGGYNNVAMGYNSMLINVDGTYNSAVGSQSLRSNTSGTSNSVFGSDALFTNTIGSYNSVFGVGALYTNLDGSSNNAFGRTALSGNTSGLNNAAFGNQSMQTNLTGSYNSAIGNRAGKFVRGDNNTFLGFESGSGNGAHDKSGSVFIGYQAGFFEINSNRLYIENSVSSAPLIYGEFDNDLLRVNGTLNINNAYSLPLIDGTINQVVQTDGAGNASWNDVIVNHEINDLTDGRSDNDGTQDGSSIFLGVNAGQNDDLTDNRNLGIGFQSLLNNTTGNNNIALGYVSLENILTGIGNVAIGNFTLGNLTTGNSNIAIGYYSQNSNLNGFGNVSLGGGSSRFNTTGDQNTAIGSDALRNNTVSSNTAIGSQSLRNNTSGLDNVGVGFASLNSNLTGSSNTTLGAFAGYSNSIGSQNVFVGYQAGYNETGSNKLYIENTNANANNALVYGEFDTNLLRINGRTEITNTTDASGTVGSGALEIGNTLRIDGDEIITNSNTVLYLQSDNNGDLGVDGTTLRVDSSTNRIGIRTTTPDYTFSVSGEANLNEGIASGVALRVNGSEALWYNGTYFSWGFGGGANFFADAVGIGVSNPNVALDVIGSIEYTGTITDVSDRRLKENFEPITNTLKRLQQISGYSYNMIDDEMKTREYGVVAQELQAVFPEMVTIIDPEKEYLGVSYIQLIPVLLEAIKEQQTLIEQQNTKIDKLEATTNSLLSDMSEIKEILNLGKEFTEK
jgi:trimeric autotransporter adhesin